MRNRKLALLIFPMLYILLGISCTKEKILQPGNWTFWTKGPINSKLSVHFLSGIIPSPAPWGSIDNNSTSEPACNSPGNFNLALKDLEINLDKQNRVFYYTAYDSISPTETRTWFGAIEINSNNWQNCNLTEIVY